MPFISITRLRVRSRRYVQGFLIQSLRSAWQAKRAAGSISVSVLRDADRAFWTRTVWRDGAAMRAFMRSGVHRRIMARLPEWCDEAALVRWVQDASEPPSWVEADRRGYRGMAGARGLVSHRRPTAGSGIREPRISGGGRTNDRWGLLADD
jgi:quinol monooxygenase YgiN